MTMNFFVKPAILFITLLLVIAEVGMNKIDHSLTGGDKYEPAEKGGYVILGDSGITLKNVNSIVVDKNNVKWFSTEAGMMSFDGDHWKVYTENKKIPDRDLKGLAHALSDGGQEIWIASPAGATVIRMPVDGQNEIETLTPENSGLFGSDVVSIATGENSIRWFGTERGISAMYEGKWLTLYYDIHYPEELFMGWPITVMASSPDGDTLFAATAGAGIARVYRDEVDAISGASVYAEWGPIILPSDNIYSICITPDGTQWFGTDAGIARHTGNVTLENWTVYTTDDGLVDNYVQAICRDRDGNIWFGTHGGISVFDGTSFTNYTTNDGLASDRVLSLAVDLDGVVWIGMDEGIAWFEDGEFFSYR
jgi:ligand-binding sensor domain-containing protein